MIEFFEFLAGWMAICGTATTILNLNLFNKLKGEIRRTEEACKCAERRERACDDARMSYQRMEEAYEARLEALSNAEKIAALLAGKDDVNA